MLYCTSPFVAVPCPAHVLRSSAPAHRAAAAAAWNELAVGAFLARGRFDCLIRLSASRPAPFKISAPVLRAAPFPSPSSQHHSQLTLPINQPSPQPFSGLVATHSHPPRQAVPPRRRFVNFTSPNPRNCSRLPSPVIPGLKFRQPPHTTLLFTCPSTPQNFSKHVRFC